MDRFFSSLKTSVRGKTVVVTGASDGIGAHLAPRLAEAGARVLLVARTAEKLRVVADQIRASGGEAHEYVANLSEDEDCQRAVREILADHGHVDIFVSNAGRSIRRSAKFQGSDRFHDFQRLMALNFYGALRMILGVLPSMLERGSGHIVHVSSFGVPTRQPRFSGYCASKSALDAALQCFAGEVAHRGVSTSSVYMPLVKTKMVESKGHSYDYMSLLTLDMACDLIERAIVTKEAEVTDGPSRFLALLYFFRPALVLAINSLVYRLEGEAPPGAALAKAPEAEAETKVREARPRGASSGSRFSGLKALASVMVFFSRFEMFARRWHFIVVRDPIIILILVLFLVVHSIVTAAMAVWRFGRQLLSRELLPARAAARGKAAACSGSEDAAAEAPLVHAAASEQDESQEVLVSPDRDACLMLRARSQPRAGAAGVAAADAAAGKPAVLRSILPLL